MAKFTNLQQLRRKIRAVENLKKITRAMNMVSAAKLRKVQTRLQQIAPYSDGLTRLLQNLCKAEGVGSIPFFQERKPVKNDAFIICGADKGLCGTFNTMLLRFARGQVEASPAKQKHIIAIGKRVADAFERGGYNVWVKYQTLPTEFPAEYCSQISAMVTDWFLNGKLDRVTVLYTKYVNIINYKPTAFTLVPMTMPDTAKKEASVDYIYEPAQKQILETLIPKYLNVSLIRMILDSNCSEHAARMTAMKNATDNAAEVIDDLTLIRNKVRQASITKELLDITTGAEAIKGH